MAVQGEKGAYYLGCDEASCASRGPVGRDPAEAVELAREEGFVLAATYCAGRGLYDQRWMCPACARGYDVSSPDEWIIRVIDELKGLTSPRRDGRIDEIRAHLDTLEFMCRDHSKGKLPYLIVRRDESDV